jgi:hypothetical protein
MCCWTVFDLRIFYRRADSVGLLKSLCSNRRREIQFYERANILIEGRMFLLRSLQEPASNLDASTDHLIKFF